MKDISESLRLARTGDHLLFLQLAFGNGNPKAGDGLLLGLASAVEESRDARPEFAIGPWQGLGKIEDKFSKFRKEVLANGEDYNACGILAIETMAEMFRFLAKEYEGNA